jgi:hypothetical protein
MSILSTGPGYFNGVGLCLRRDAFPQADASAGWEMEAGEACGHLDAIGDFVKGTSPLRTSMLPENLVLYVLGGEPFSRLDDLERILAAGVRNQLTSEVATTAAWATDTARVKAALAQLHGKLASVQIFTTHALLARSGVEPIRRLMGEARAARLSVVLRCSVGPGAPFPRELLSLDEFNDEMTLLDVMPLAPPKGQAAPPGDEAFLLPEVPVRRRCAEVFTFLVAPGGDVYPCLRGLGADALRLGSLRREAMSDIVARAAASAALGKLRAEGPRHLYDAVSGSPAKRLLHSGYLDSCHFHNHALHEPDMACVVRGCEAALAARRGVEVSP